MWILERVCAKFGDSGAVSPAYLPSGGIKRETACDRRVSYGVGEPGRVLQGTFDARGIEGLKQDFLIQEANILGLWVWGCVCLHTTIWHAHNLEHTTVKILGAFCVFPVRRRCVLLYCIVSTYGCVTCMKSCQSVKG